MSSKILYGLGCTCDPHMIFQNNFKDKTAPSIFAGCVHLQCEIDKFIPLMLFDGDIRDNFFGIDKWRVARRIEYFSQSPKFDGIYQYEDGSTFQYFNNLQKREFIEFEGQYKVGIKNDFRRIYVNEKLKIINFHPFDKIPGNNPEYEDYQLRKYDFFEQNKYNLKFALYMHKDTTEHHLQSFYNFLVNNKYNIKNFTLFNRNDKLQINNFRNILIPNENSPQSNIYYGQQVSIIQKYVQDEIFNDKRNCY